MAVSAEFQAQLDRATAYIESLKTEVANLTAQLAAAGSADSDDTAALSSELDTEGAPAATAPAPASSTSTSENTAAA